MMSFYAMVSTVIDPSDMPPKDVANRIYGGIAALIVFTSAFLFLPMGCPCGWISGEAIDA